MKSEIKEKIEELKRLVKLVKVNGSSLAEIKFPIYEDKLLKIREKHGR